MEMFERGYQVAAELGRHVFDRVRPLPGRLVAPLGAFVSRPAVPVNVPEGAAEGWITDEPEPDLAGAVEPDQMPGPGEPL